MPHFFITLNANEPNPGRWTRDKVADICSKHRGKLTNLWMDDPDNPQRAYVLVEDGDLDGLTADLHGRSVITLHPTS